MSMPDRIDLPGKAIFKIGEIIPAKQGLGPAWHVMITGNVINAGSQDSVPFPESTCVQPISDEFMKFRWQANEKNNP